MPIFAEGNSIARIVGTYCISEVKFCLAYVSTFKMYKFITGKVLRLINSGLQSSNWPPLQWVYVIITQCLNESPTYRLLRLHENLFRQLSQNLV